MLQSLRRHLCSETVLVEGWGGGGGGGVVCEGVTINFKLGCRLV